MMLRRLLEAICSRRKVAFRRLTDRTRKPPDPFALPIIINSRDRVDCLRELVTALEQRGYRNLHILDNDSAYPPLLDYYRTLDYPVHLLRRNLGPLALWQSGLFGRIARSFYVYTDPDVVPDPVCPRDFMAVFLRLLYQYPWVDKVGFSLRTDDIPEHYSLRTAVIEHEEAFWRRPLGAQPLAYAARIDTTFALYRPGTQGRHQLDALRSAPPYTARHLAWYEDSSHPSGETRFYSQRARHDPAWSETHWSREWQRTDSERPG